MLSHHMDIPQAKLAMARIPSLQRLRTVNATEHVPERCTASLIKNVLRRESPKAFKPVDGREAREARAPDAIATPTGSRGNDDFVGIEAENIIDAHIAVEVNLHIGKLLELVDAVIADAAARCEARQAKRKGSYSTALLQPKKSPFGRPWPIFIPIPKALPSRTHEL